MNKGKQKDDTFLDSLNKERMKASDEAREKSLLSFQDGLKQAGLHKPKKKHRKLRQRVIGIASTAVAAGIAGLLVLSTGIIGDSNSDNTVGQGNGRDVVHQNEENAMDVQNEESKNLIETVWNRPAFDYDDINGVPTSSIFNSDLKVYVPRSWTIDETEGDAAHSIHMSGTNGERMNLVLFNEDYDQEEFDARLQELTASFAEAEEVPIPVDEFIDEIRLSHQVSFPYENVFPFETENAEITAFFDEDNGKFMELYISELFGHPMIFTSELSLDDTESWMLPIRFFTFMQAADYPYMIHGSEGDLHPEFNRPIEKSVLLQIGAMGVEEVDVELYENEELNMTSYLPRGTEVERTEHGEFIEWRFTEPNVSENSFYAFGKLKSGFPLENGKEIMFDAFDIDLSYSEDLGGPIPYHYSYYSGMDEEFIDGYIELFESGGEWYYKHKHADREDYNGGVYIQRLDLFIDSIEWH
ncbi:hypothetical protein [Oceanobacillus damuensis]|uniref:hypothetical protein n=1 Tax=Oceanobacillus damuensis TaxID=937928 RepID=UPI000836F75D|nr:hypothetical protein [Oceanobacillus damuensis]